MTLETALETKVGNLLECSSHVFIVPSVSSPSPGGSLEFWMAVYSKATGSQARLDHVQMHLDD